MANENKQHDESKKHEEIQVVVHYVAASQPFKRDYPPAATVGQVKQDAMTELGLKEGVTPDGGTVTYPLFHDKNRLDNPNVTIGDLAGHQQVLQLKLVQQLTQG